MEDGWCLTESDPQVFSELLRQLGVKGLQVDDLYSLDAEALEQLQPVHALIFLFKYVAAGGEGARAGVEVDPLDCGVWFANQVINNSCGTIAALNAVMNIAAPGVEIGPELGNLKDFGAGMGSLDLGHVVASSDRIREVHNSFSKTSPFALDPASVPDDAKEDAYHFICYLPINGVLYELDGLNAAPVMHAPVPEPGEGSEGAGGAGGWLDAAREVIQARIATYPPGSVMFNLLAVRSAAIPRLEAELAQEGLSEGRRFELAEQLEQERAKLAKGQMENSLRRHNILPVVLELFKALAEHPDREAVVDEARERGKTRKAAGREED